MMMDGVPLAALLSVNEDKNSICVYTAKACSPLLCVDQFHPVMEHFDLEEWEDMVDVKPAIDVGSNDVSGASSSKPPIEVKRSDSGGASSKSHSDSERNERSTIFGKSKGNSKDVASAQKGVIINSIPEKKEVDLIVIPNDSICTI
eukprot:13686388-Ditylum_brightwellii.AAC.1